ncbi:MAG TPA: hypothetical protein VHN14_22110 [Kofleriaceae bacterium]|jgi:hypothetical protein|nr:hypothetical protein [Kofleriaceae bacterium]
MPARKPPEAWFWSYDIKADNIDSILLGVRLMRLSSYHIGTKQRFAALMYEEPGPARSYALLLDAAGALQRVADTGHRPVSVTVDTSGEAPQFSLVLEVGPGPVANLHIDLDEAGVRALLDDQHAIADLATYTAGGVRRYAVIVEERAAQSWLFTGVTAAELDARLLEYGAALVRVRAYAEGGRRLLTTIAERIAPGAWAWYAGLDPDEVAKSLTKNKAYPVDLDAWWEDGKLRFCVIMYRDPKE